MPEDYARRNNLGYIRHFTDNRISGTRRDLWMVKVMAKVSGSFRSVEDTQEYFVIMRYIGTAHMHVGNVFTANREALSGNTDSIFS